MIITRSPLRISLGGGGTDLPSYYREHGGFVLSAAIDKYVYITLHETFQPEFLIKYSATEVVQTVGEIKHPIIREALRMVPVAAPHLEIVSMSDIPAGTGLGSSGSFTVALLRALHTLNKEFVPRSELAEQACEIEIDILGEPIGKQDQYIASFGGITAFDFRKDDTVDVSPLQVSQETLYNLEDNLLLFFTGFTRSASAILAEQDQKTRGGDSGMIDHLHQIKAFGYQSKAALECGDLRNFAAIMHEHWERKKYRSKSMTNSTIDNLYGLARRNGALGGKLIGAGGGGFLMFYTEDKTRLRHAMLAAGLREVRMRFDFEGTQLLTRCVMLPPVAILAGGLATRLRPVTETIPKALIEVAGEPFLAHQLRLLREHGFAHVVMLVGYLGEQIQAFAGNGRHFGLQVDYVFDGPRLLGTAGALKRALPVLGEEFAVVYGDSYLRCDYSGAIDAFRASGKLGLMTVYRNEGQWDTSNVEFAEGRIVAYDKANRTPAMRHIDYGLGAFRSAAFDAVPDGVPHDLATLYQDLLCRGELAAWESPERFYEIGSLQGIGDLERFLKA